ncbi:zinc finger HIT domain-containing protein 2 [Paroedura picta]|uniref:zinc finger HIT domain-containing protein 2 n=1 Tax=Paroedura picta TaxID=143630 RepID=UPI004056013D
MEADGSIPTPDPSCGLCVARRAPYTCPRCHLRFCSVPCYRQHGSCAQDFQRRELQIRLEGQRQDPASQRRLREALLRLRELREPGDADPQLGLDPHLEQAEVEALWEQLSPEHRKRFQWMLHSGEISALLPPWQPWWTGRGRDAALIQELGEAPSPSSPGPDALQQPQAPGPRPEPPARPAEACPSRVPPVPAALPALSSLTRSPVSPLVGLQLPNVLFAYAYALALYNGEADEAQLIPEFCETVLDLSGALGAQRGFGSVAEALHAALQAATAGRYPECQLGPGGAMAAVAQILMGECQAQQKGYTLAALAHLARLLGQGKRRASAGDRPRLYAAKKKCDFLLSWVNENEGELSRLALEVQRECQAHLDRVRAVGAVTQELEKMWGGKVPPPQRTLIEELD